MRTHLPSLTKLWLLLAMVLSAVVACDDSRQSPSDTCQIDSDCAAGFTCSGDGQCTVCADDAAACGACEPGDVGCACLPDASCSGAESSATRVVCDPESQRCVAEMVA